MPSIARAATALEPYETLIHEDGTLPKDVAILMSFGVSESDARQKVGLMYMDGEPKFEQLCGRTYLKSPSGPWVTDLGEAYILAAKAEWEQTGGGGGGHAIGGDDGGDDGGGGGAGHSFDPPSGGDAQPPTIEWNELELTHKAGEVYGNGQWSPMESYTVKVHIDDSFKAQLNSELSAYKDWFVVLQHHNGNSKEFYLAFYMTKGDVSDIYVTGEPSSTQLGNVLCNFLGETGYREYELPNRWASASDMSVNHTAKTIDIYFRNDNDYPYNNIFGTNPYNLYNGHGFAWSLGSSEPAPTPEPDPTGGDDPSGGDDEPSAPTPPEIDPTEYTTYEGDNTDITVNVTFDNDGGQTDLTPITTRLDRIYARLGDIGRDLLNFDQHVQSAFYSLENKLDGLFSSYFGSVKTWLEMIYSRVDDINRNIGNLDKSTDDKPDVTGIESLLRTIDTDLKSLDFDPDYSYFDELLEDVTKIREAAEDILATLDQWPEYLTDTPIDLSKFDTLISDVGEILDNIDALMDDLTEWWAQMLGNLEDIIDKLENLDIGVKNPFTRYGTPRRYTPNEIQLSTASDELDDAIRRLLAKFPFSTINNLTLIMTALVRPAQTPIFDLPVPNPVTPDEPYVVHVDLSDWDGVAAVGRVGITLWAIARVSRRTVNMWTREEGM